VVPLELPPLRDRPDDIPPLVDHFLVAAARKFGKGQTSVAPAVLDRLQAYGWPGNVRELENCIERMIVLARAPHLTVDDLPAIVREGPEAAERVGPRFELPAGGVPLQSLEKQLIRQALERSRGRLGPAARLLGISYKTLQYRVRKHGLDLRNEVGAATDPASEDPDD
jgi:two-component system NtrC family response regulator